MEEELDSRLIIQRLDKTPQWTLKRGPLSRSDFKKLPKSHWTLLVGGVDRFIPEVSALLDHFNFIPQWRIDDVMISLAVQEGSVGPHYDNYDVFLYQASGRRRWLLTSLDCVESNYQPGLELRLMKDFKVEQEYILEEGDMLYLPPHIGHHGISQSKECITYSFGYRSYQALELWDSLGDYLASKNSPSLLYQDPPWTHLKKTSQLPKSAWLQARALMQALLDDESLMQDWFGSFATQLDNHAQSLLPIPANDNKAQDINTFKHYLCNSMGLIRNPLCRFAYSKAETGSALSLYINGSPWNIKAVTEDLVEKVANNRSLLLKEILVYLDQRVNVEFLYELWKLEWLEFYINSG